MQNTKSTIEQIKHTIGVFPGSFDPISMGHLDIIQRASRLVDTLYVAIGNNINKVHLFDINKRADMVELCVQGYNNIEIVTYDGLSTECAKSIGATVIFRALRNTVDFELEKSIQQVYLDITDNNIECMYLISSAKYSHISSSVIRDLMHHQHNLQGYVPNQILDILSLC
ncbi:MAG: pantetheine-phosphate adenylyltransferase [Clostridiales bacterium]|jgi:pantetheine-phosphate adenylyltransferase|nr:pantetheine-phosphate adenylyltransferase [Clostridiales bacterium]